MLILAVWRFTRDVWRDTLALQREMRKRYPHLKGGSEPAN
jgi:hypothetical protein